jgi:glycosyltransferase involved in cell wall biosynthesis
MGGMTFPGRLLIQQRVLPTYRLAFFDALAAACPAGLGVCAGLPRPSESIAVSGSLQLAQHLPVRNLHLLAGPLYLCYQADLLEQLAGWDPQALILEANPRYLSSPAAVRWMKRRGRPVLGWGLGAAPLTGPLAGLRAFQRLSFLRQFDALLTYSRRGAEQYAGLGLPSDRIFVAPNAAARRPTRPLPTRPKRFEGPPRLLFVGRLQARKRVDLLLQACEALTEARPRLVIVGDGPERIRLAALAKTIYPPAEFPGAKHGPELAPYFAAADLFVLPGTGGLAVQEAMAWGLPVIMGRGDGTNDDLVRPANGWQIPADDLGALTETLRLALADAGRLRAMGAESYRLAAEEINLEKMVEGFLGALNALQ